MIKTITRNDIASPWIPVSAGVPEENTWCFIKTKEHRVLNRKYNDGIFVSCVNGADESCFDIITKDVVTHWRYNPESNWELEAKTEDEGVEVKLYDLDFLF